MLLNFFLIWFLLYFKSSAVLIFSNSKDLRTIQLNGSSLSTTVIVDNLGDTTALDFSFREKIIFFTDLATEKIQGVHFESSVKEPFDVVDSGLSTPDGLAVDWLTRKLYWTDSASKRLEVCQLNGQFKGVHRKVLFYKDLDAPRAIALVPLKGLIFWTDWGDKPKIERASMDGKFRKILISDDVWWPNGLAVDLPKERIYWLDGKLKFISSSDYNGINRKNFMSNYPQTFGLTIDKEWLYVTDWTSMGISSCNKITFKCKLFFPNVKNPSNQLLPMGIKVFSSYSQPEAVTGCDENNGGCSHLCLLSSDPPGYSCACPTGILLSSDNKTCASEEKKFFLLLRRTDIRKISMDTDVHIDVVLPYGKNIKYGIAIDFDPVEQHIYWTDDDAKAIVKANLNSAHVEVINADLNHPDGIAIDWIARNLYFSDMANKSISVSRLDGSFRKTLISTNLDKPRAVVVNPWEALLFWSDWGTNPKIERAFLDGSHRTEIVNTEIIWPNGLALDLEEERLFWGDAKMDRIEVCDFNGDNRKLLLDQVAHPFAITVLDEFVYWTDWHERAIHRTDKRIGGKREGFLDSLPDMMGLKAISIDQHLGLDRESGCSKLNGGCQQLCLNRKLYTAQRCSCANGWELESDLKSCKRIKLISFTKKPPEKTTITRKPCPGNRFPCVSGKIDCVSTSHICDGESDCEDGSDEVTCPKPTIMYPSGSSSSVSPEIPKTSTSISSSSSSSSSKSSPFSIQNELPIIGICAALTIVVVLCCVAIKFVSRDGQHPTTKELLSVPLMHHDQKTIQISSPPDLLMSDTNLDSSRCDASSISEITSVSRIYPLLRDPPPSPATTRSSFASNYKNHPSVASM